MLIYSHIPIWHSHTWVAINVRIYYIMVVYTLISIWYSHTWVAIKERTLLYNGNIYTHIYLVFTYKGDNKCTYITIKC